MSQPTLVQRTMFAQDSVKQLHQSDFVDLESDTKINIIYRECMLVLFYGDNIESTNLATVWSVAAKNTVGPVFAACNLMVEKRVAEAFSALNMQNGALQWAALKTIPYILIYQNGWPVAFYNGERSVQSIIDYSLTLACKAEYHEPFNLFGGMTISNEDNLVMKGDTQYGISANPYRKDSLAYSANENVRGYDKTDQVNRFDSLADQQAAAHVISNERADRVGIQQSTVPVTALPTGPAEFPPSFGGVSPGALPASPTEQGIIGGVRVAPSGQGGEVLASPTEMEVPPGSSTEA